MIDSTSRAETPARLERMNCAEHPTVDALAGCGARVDARLAVAFRELDRVVCHGIKAACQLWSAAKCRAEIGGLREFRRRRVPTVLGLQNARGLAKVLN